jgi:hypothetical protein
MGIRWVIEEGICYLHPELASRVLSAAHPWTRLGTQSLLTEEGALSSLLLCVY